MTDATRFLGSLGRAFSALALYSDAHPALTKAVDAAWRDLETLLTARRRAAFTFLGETVLLGDAPLHDSRAWEWSERLSSAGIQRIEFESPLARDAFEAFVREAFVRLGAGNHAGAVSRPADEPGIRYGSVGLRGETDAAAAAPMPTATLAFALDEEIEAARWMHDEVRNHRPIPLVEVEAIVGSLSIALHADPQIAAPLVRIKECDEYTTKHSLNVSLLAMGLAERLAVSGRDLRAYGVAGLLHDIGKTLVPKDVLSKPGRLTDEERELMNRHPADGARLILRADEDLDLAAIVAFEHHINFDGSGYPACRYGRACHPASRLVHVCDVFDALRTNRPYRPAWSTEQTLDHLRARAGIEFEADLVDAFLGMMASS